LLHQLALKRDRIIPQQDLLSTVWAPVPQRTDYLRAYVATCDANWKMIQPPQAHRHVQVWAICLPVATSPIPRFTGLELSLRFSQIFHFFLAASYDFFTRYEIHYRQIHR